MASETSVHAMKRTASNNDTNLIHGGYSLAIVLIDSQGIAMRKGTSTIGSSGTSLVSLLGAGVVSAIGNARKM